MKKIFRACVLSLAVILFGGCTESQNPVETATTSPTKIPTSIPTNTSLPERPQIHITSGPSPNVDGRMETGEWDQAVIQELSDGTLLYLMYAEDSLYLALDSEVLGTVNVGVLRDGELWVLHSSAALGSLIYEYLEGDWLLRKDFEWCCRTTSPLAESQQLLADEGWLSHNQFVGDETQTEYRVKIPKDEIYLAVTYRYRDDSNAAFWPETLGENDLLIFEVQLRQGDQAVFSPALWAKLIVEESN